jgi:hypothetical protein
MKTIASLALAGALAAAALVPSVTAASAHDWDHHHHYYHGGYYGGGWYGGGDFLAGTALGLTFGALASPYYAPAYGYYPPPPPPPLYAAGPGDAHIQWCSAHYRSYSPETNLWVDYDGVMHQCMAPY